MSRLSSNLFMLKGCRCTPPRFSESLLIKCVVLFRGFDLFTDARPTISKNGRQCLLKYILFICLMTNFKYETEIDLFY